MEIVDALGGTPFIPFKSNAIEPKDDGIWTRMYHLFHYRREEFMKRYHQRAAAETVFSMIKTKFGPSVKSKSEMGQVNEVLAKVLCHNICVLIRAMHELGIEPAFGSKRTFGSETPLEPKLFIRAGFWCKAAMGSIASLAPKSASAPALRRSGLQRRAAFASSASSRYPLWSVLTNAKPLDLEAQLPNRKSGDGPFLYPASYVAVGKTCVTPCPATAHPTRTALDAISCGLAEQSRRIPAAATWLSSLLRLFLFEEPFVVGGGE